MKTWLVLLLIVLSLFGIFDAGYLTWQRFNNIIPPCSVEFECETVLTSKWSSFGPIPVSALGLIFYSTVFLFSCLELVEKKIKIFDFDNEEILMILGSFGFLFSLFLLFLMGVVINSWCFYCLISAAISISIFSIMLFSFNIFSDRSWWLLKNKILALLYRPVKMVFFMFDPEMIHNFMTGMGVLLGTNPVSRALTAWAFKYDNEKTARNIDGIHFPNPIGLSAGFDYNADLTGILPSVGFGFMMIGTVTYDAYEGNPKPRLSRLPKSKALVVNKGLKSIGAVGIIKKLTGKKFGIPVGVSIASTNKRFSNDGEQLKDIAKTFILFEKSQVKHSFYELNISCPNTFGGEPFTNPNRLTLLLRALSKLNISKPVYIKMPIDQSKQETLALLKVADKFKFIKGINIGNLTKDKNNPAVLPEDKAKWDKLKGNLSGKPTFDRSNLLIRLAKNAFGNRFTIIGTGGIFGPDDALEKINAGADLVELITGMIFVGPQVIGRIDYELAGEVK